MNDEYTTRHRPQRMRKARARARRPDRTGPHMRAAPSAWRSTAPHEPQQVSYLCKVHIYASVRACTRTPLNQTRCVCVYDRYSHSFDIYIDIHIDRADHFEFIFARR